MKSFLFITFSLIFITNALFASWYEHWIHSVQYSEKQQIDLAEDELNKSIKLLEEEHDNSHPYVYIDRAWLYLRKDKYKESLADLNKALSYANIENKDYAMAICIRSSVYRCLDMMEEANSDDEIFRKVCTDAPKIEFFDDVVIIRNVPKCECSKNILKQYFIEAEFCEGESDIEEHNDIMIIKIKKKCSCGCTQNEVEMGTDKPSKESIENCRWMCDRNADLAYTWCHKVFPSAPCYFLCKTVVDQLKDLCHWCCNGGDFYERCIKPFANILKHMPKECID